MQGVEGANKQKKKKKSTLEIAGGLVKLTVNIIKFT